MVSCIGEYEKARAYYAEPLKIILAATYSPRENPSTIGPGGLNYRVRDGNGCDPSGMATRKFMRFLYIAPSKLHS